MWRRAGTVLVLLAGGLPGQQEAASALPALARQMLAAHNSVRAKLNEPPLQWSGKLAAWAQNWADTLVMQHEFSHRPRNPYGENLFEIEGATATPQQVVTAWAAEAAGYDYRTNTCRGVCGHYTQIVWRNTRRVGCAVSRGPGLQIWVCNYDPPGNVVGRKPY